RRPRPARVRATVFAPDRRLIALVGVLGGVAMPAAACIKRRRIVLNPAQHCRMSDGEAALQEACCDITVAQSISAIPSHPTHHDLRSMVGALAIARHLRCTRCAQWEQSTRSVGNRTGPSGRLACLSSRRLPSCGFLGMVLIWKRHSLI